MIIMMVIIIIKNENRGHTSMSSSGDNFCENGKPNKTFFQFLTTIVGGVTFGVTVSLRHIKLGKKFLILSLRGTILFFFFNTYT